MQADRVETLVCAAYAQFSCYGTGSVWVCHLCKPNITVYANVICIILKCNIV